MPSGLQPPGSFGYVVVNRPRPEVRELYALEGEAIERRIKQGTQQKHVLIVLRGPERLVTKFESAALSPEMMASDEATVVWCAKPDAWEFATSREVRAVLDVFRRRDDMEFDELQKLVKLPALRLRRLLFAMEGMELVTLLPTNGKPAFVTSGWDEVIFLDHEKEQAAGSSTPALAPGRAS